jgi:hypothetical protein
LLIRHTRILPQQPNKKQAVCKDRAKCSISLPVAVPAGTADTHSITSPNPHPLRSLLPGYSGSAVDRNRRIHEIRKYLSSLRPRRLNGILNGLLLVF